LDEIIEEMDTPEEEIIDEVDTPEETKDTVELSEMSYNDLVKEVKSRDIKLPQNAKKETLIDLLSK
jgi:predicted HTH domain antitoxin